jgi:uridine phosphorylase
MSLEITPIAGLVVGRVPEGVLVCGDPGRAELAAGQIDDVVLLSDKREYRCYSGFFGGMRVAVCSHGIGAPGAAIAFEELITAGARQIIRVGTCGALQTQMASGDLVIATAAVQNTGYGLETVPVGYPAVADMNMTMALREAAAKAGNKAIAGIVLSRDNFYRGVDLPSNPEYERLSEANVLAVEMECAALFLVGSLRKIQTGAILAVDGNVLDSGGEMMETYDPGQDIVTMAVEAEITIALLALQLVKNDIA